MKKNYELEYKLCTNDLLGKVQINSFERVYNWLYNAYIWLRKRTRQNKTFLIVQVYFDLAKHYTLGVYQLKIESL